MIANEMRRDSANIRQGDCIGFAFDTFHDRRNAVQFEVNPLGGRTDGQSTNERQYNADWNPVWELAVGQFDGGWTIEAAIPFKSLRYGPGHDAGLGLPGASQQQVEERDLVPDDDSAGLRHRPRRFLRRRSSPTLVGIESAAAVAEPRDQAVRDRQSDDRSHRRRRS